MMRATTVSLTLALVASVFGTSACGPGPLSDPDLTAYARTKYDADEMEGKRLILGVHRGVRVVVEFPCSDLCPDNTTRIIHYDLPADATCTAKGGAIVELATPLGIGYFPVEYCVPSVLAEEERRKVGLSNNALKLTKAAMVTSGAAFAA